MDEMLFNALKSYYHALGVTGYMPHSQAEKLLVLIFIRDLVFGDYRGLLSKQDYFIIERTLKCLYGSSCLIPYPDYLKMGKLHLGEVTEMAQRIKTLEDEPVLKVMHSMDGQEDPDSDIMIVEEDEY